MSQCLSDLDQELCRMCLEAQLLLEIAGLNQSSRQIASAIHYVQQTSLCNRVDNTHPDTLARPFHLRPVTVCVC